MEAMNRLWNIIGNSGCDAVLIPGTDPHQSEYPPQEWRSRPYFTGFTGSFGHVIATGNKALLTTDSRYELQVVQELNAEKIDPVLH